VEDVTVVVGGQAGSEGKGMVCDQLHRERNYALAVRVGGPNAGHSVVNEEGRKFALRQLPVAAVSDPECQLVIAAGSEVDPMVLDVEVAELEGAGYSIKDRLVIDRSATIIDAAAVDLENGIGTGTTGKGIGGARARRALRQAKLVQDSNFDDHGYLVDDTQGVVRKAALNGFPVLIEGTQGHVLGSHAGYYPYSTSGDCRASDFMAWCGLPPMRALVYLVLRYHPIRIAGNSGPLPGETSWEDLGIKPELTTVTRKVRRVGHWNWTWPAASIKANLGPGGLRPVLTFADYAWPELAGKQGYLDDRLPEGLLNFMDTFQERLGLGVYACGTGPRSWVEVG
jgi:adenylosuccinate synthase